MFKHREGILAWYDKRITTAMVEGINNKIKVMKRETWASQITVISSFVCWPCTMPVSRHSCEDPGIYSLSNSAQWPLYENYSLTEQN